MKVDLQYIDNGFIAKFWGKISVSDILNVNNLIYGREEFDSHKFQVFDFSEADLTDITHKRSEEPAATDNIASQYSPDVKVATVATESHAIEFTQRYIDESIRFGSPWQFKIFNNLDDALNWVKS